MRKRLLIVIAAAVLVAVGTLSVDLLALWWGSRLPEDEAHRVGELAGVAAGDTIAEIGAGRGEMLRVLAPKTLPDGRVFVTELSDARLADLRALVDAQEWPHVSVLHGDPNGTALPDGCCDIIYMRHVYHHFADRRQMAAALRRSLAPSGRLVVIDFEPVWLLSVFEPVATNGARTHGVTAIEVIGDLTGAGLTLIRHDPRWTRGSFMTMFGAARLEAMSVARDRFRVDGESSHGDRESTPDSPRPRCRSHRSRHS